MRMMDELKHMFLYSANKKVYAPIDEKDRRKNSAILLLTPSLDVSSRLMTLPYVYNPNLFTSFYVDRNVMAYIDNTGIENIEFDEQEEEQLSESMFGSWGSKCKFKFDDKISIIDERYIYDVYNKKTVSEIAKTLDMRHVPESIKVIVHPNVADLRKNAPKRATNTFKDNLYSFTSDNEIHVLSKYVYDPERMCGPYEMYLKSELIFCMLSMYNQELPDIAVKGISYALSGADEWIRNNDTSINSEATEWKFAYTTRKLIKTKGMRIIHKYIRTGDLKIYAGFVTSNTLKFITNIIFEAELSYFDRQRLLPSEFGIPEKRKYPMPDEEHVRAAIRMFNNCDPDDEEQLAHAIIKKMKKFGITDVKVSAANRFKKYYNPDSSKKKNESYLLESFVDTDYGDIMKICSHLSNDELKRITFYDTYRDSQFVIKRIIHRIGGEPVGFLDVYRFPSKPEIAQIVIAVDNRYHGQGIGKTMVGKLMSSNLDKDNDFEMYYWTAHPDNEPSKTLALTHGFKDTGYTDKYGRMVFTKRVRPSTALWDEIPDYLKPVSGHEDSSYNENFFITESMAIFNEADDPKYSNKLRRYLYAERIRNNKGVLEIYDKVRASNPEIRKMYLKISMYKKLNLFVDLSYYHALFLEKNVYKMDKAVNFYFDFLNRLINNPDIDSEYKKKTVFIPVDPDVWPVQPNTELYDFKKNLNPISIIFRLIRTNPGALKKAWGDKDIIFVGSRGYFKVDFSKFELKNLPRFKNNLRKLMSTNEPIEDEYDTDELVPDSSQEDDIAQKNVDSKKAMAAKMIDRIENNTSIKINDVSAVNNTKNNTSDGYVTSIDKPHLRIVSDQLKLDKKISTEEFGVAIITLDPEGPDGYVKTGSNLDGLKNISSYCMP